MQNSVVAMFYGMEVNSWIFEIKIVLYFRLRLHVKLTGVFVKVHCSSDFIDNVVTAQ